MAVSGTSRPATVTSGAQPASERATAHLRRGPPERPRGHRVAPLSREPFGSRLSHVNKDRGHACATAPRGGAPGDPAGQGVGRSRVADGHAGGRRGGAGVDGCARRRRLSRDRLLVRFREQREASTADGQRGRDSAQYVAAGGRRCAVGVPAESTGRATRHDCIADPAGETTSPDTVASAMADNHRNEIGYAAARGKPVRYVTDEPDLLARITRTEER